MNFSELATTYDEIAEARGKDKKVKLLADLFSGLDEDTLRAAAHFTVGEVTDPSLADKLRLGPGTIRNIVAEITDTEPDAIEDRVKETGDLSAVAAEAAGGSDTLTVTDLWRRVNRTVKRDESRDTLLRHVFEHTSEGGVRYFTRMVLNKMRIGVGQGTLIDALAHTFAVDASSIQHVYALTNDIGLAAVRARRGTQSLAQTSLGIFRPYQFMNAHKVDDRQAIFDRLEGKRIELEIKYDGARLQIHVKAGGPPDVHLYSRKLQDVTDSLPDVIDAIRTAWRGGDAIVEGEAVAFDTSLQEKQPFQAVLSRLGREHDVDAKAEEIPLVLFLFDVLYHDGRNLMDTPQTERRTMLSDLFHASRRIKVTERIASDDPDEVDTFFKDAIEAGHEGLMAKDPDGTYAPGKRTYTWMKLKPEFESLDVVVVGGIWGSGNRKGLLSSLLVAVRNGDDFLTVGKVGTGFSQEDLASLTETLEEQVITTNGRHVEIEPSTVIEVDFQDIQTTDAYTSGYALRIPRYIRERTDKSPKEADSLDRLEKLFEQTS